MTANIYKKYVEKVGLLNEQRKRRSLPIARGLEHFLSNFTEIAENLELKGATKTHVMGLSACMGHLKKSESALGLFSDPFIDIMELIAKEIVQLTKKDAPQGTIKVVQWWLETTLLTVVGLLELARAKKVSKEEILPDSHFTEELLLTLLFYTSYPKLVFRQMADALDIQNAPLFINAFEALALIFALVAYSNEEEIRKEFGEALSLKLQEAIHTLQVNLAEEKGEIQSYLKLAEMALEKGEIDQLSLSLQDLMKAAGYTKEALAKDITAMKDLFKRLKIAYLAAHEKSTNMVHIIG